MLVVGRQEARKWIESDVAWQAFCFTRLRLAREKFTARLRRRQSKASFGRIGIENGADFETWIQDSRITLWSSTVTNNPAASFMATRDEVETSAPILIDNRVHLTVFGTLSRKGGWEGGRKWRIPIELKPMREKWNFRGESRRKVRARVLGIPLAVIDVSRLDRLIIMSIEWARQANWHLNLHFEWWKID